MATTIKVGKREFHFTSNLDEMSEEKQNEFFQHLYWPTVNGVVYNSFKSDEQALITKALETHGERLVNELINSVHIQ